MPPILFHNRVFKKNNCFCIISWLLLGTSNPYPSDILSDSKSAFKWLRASCDSWEPKMPNESLTKLEQVSPLFGLEYVWKMHWICMEYCVFSTKCRLVYSTAGYSKMRLFKMSKSTEMTFIDHVDLNDDMAPLSEARVVQLAQMCRVVWKPPSPLPPLGI